jgi:single-strand DNA-binding protein
MASLNKVILIGRLTADPELKQTGNGVAVTSFTLAVDRKYNKDTEKKADFITVVAWRQTAEFICKYFRKGSAIIVLGELQTRSWDDSNGKKRFTTEVVASEVSFAESKKNPETNSPTADNFATYAQANFEAVEDETLPF